MSDCTALQQAFPSYGIPNNCCSGVSGVACINGRVSGVSFPGDKFPRLTGNFPNIGQLTALEFLDISQHGLNGNLPDSLFGLTRLKELHLNRNQFVGGISEAIGNLNQLRVLSLFSNSFSGPAPSSISSMSLLVVLELHINKFSGEIPSSYGNLRNLVRLDLNDNQFVGSIPNSFGNLALLEGLFVNENQLTGSIPDSILRLPVLNTLNVSISSDPTQPASTISNSSTLTSITDGTSATTILPSNNLFSPKSSQPTPTQSQAGAAPGPSDAGTNALPTAAIVGGVLGALLMIAIAVFVAIYVRMKRSRKGLDEEIVPRTVSRPGSVASGHLQRAKTVSSMDGSLQDASSTSGIVVFNTLTRAPSTRIEKSAEAGYSLQPQSVELVPLSSHPSSPTMEKKTSMRWQQPANSESHYQVFPPSVTEVPLAYPKQDRLPDQYISHPPEERRSSISKSAYSPGQAHSTSNQHVASMEEASTWSPDQVSQWLESVDVSPRLCIILKENGVTGYQLLVMTEERSIILDLAPHPLDTHNHTMTDDCGVLRRSFRVLNTPRDDCCDGFPGITCRNNRVIKLAFSGANKDVKLTGGFPDISALDLLEYLDISNHQLTGPIPDYLFGMGRLKELHLNNNGFNGVVSDSIGNLKQLQVLALDHNSFRGPAPSSIGSLPSLAILSERLPIHRYDTHLIRKPDQTRGNVSILVVFPASPIVTFPKLIALSVYSNRLSGQITNSFKSIPGDFLLAMQENYFSGPVPAFIFGIGDLHLENNCFSPSGSSIQRPQADCDAFFKSLPSSPSPTIPTIISSPPNLTTASAITLTSFTTTGPQSDLNSVGEVSTSAAGSSSTPSNGMIVDPTQTSTSNSGDSAPSSSGPPITIIAGAITAILVAAIVCIIFRSSRRKTVRESFSRNATRNGSLSSGRSLRGSQSPSARSLRGRQSASSLTSGDIEIFKCRSNTEAPFLNQSNPQEKEVILLDRSIPVEKPAIVSFQNMQEAQTVSLDPHATIVEKEKKEMFPSPVAFTPTSSPETPPMLPKQDHLPEAYLSNIKDIRRPSISKSTYNPSLPREPTQSNHDSFNVAGASLWSPEQVSRWLESVDVSPRLAVILKEHGVTGYQLLLMTEERLVEMGIELAFSRKLVMEAVDLLRARAGGAGEETVAVVGAAPPQYRG
ncbi:hypothetical protein HDU97_002142 [Phlyctochytrium planicorne]|nr:hypothetical protein HDU97_002142 [Phlyctochytrium planicorne]